MPKRGPKAKQSDFLRFRPYHAFTTPADQVREAGRNRLWRIIWLIAFIAVALVSAAIFFRLAR
jgi:hypothetical protein